MKVIATIEPGRRYLATVTEDEIRLLSGRNIHSPRIGDELDVCSIYHKTSHLLRHFDEAKKVANNFRALADLLDSFAPTIQGLVTTNGGEES